MLRQDFIRLVGAVTASVAPAPMLALAQAPPEAAAAPAIAHDSAARFRDVYQFYNQTIKGSIGLRGIGLQLRVEKAASLDDLRALRMPYLKAVLKARGSATALALRDRLDALCGGAPEADDFALPEDKVAAQRRAAAALTSIAPATR